MASSVSLRRKLVQNLEKRGLAKTQAVRDAFRNVPRERFIPEIVAAEGLAAIYEDAVFVTKTDSRGQGISSSSQPGIMAPMLDYLDLEPGHRVLEIGAGTGYNAALMKHIVGVRGQVTAVDIDEDTARRARRALRSGGYRVDVRAADGHRGWRANAPYDRIIATTSSDTIPKAWFRQLRIGGMVVLPLRLTTVTFSPQIAIALRKERTGFVSVDACLAGFMPMRPRPGSDSPRTGIVQLLERVGGRVSTIGAGGDNIERMRPAARAELLRTFASKRRITEVARSDSPLVGLRLYVALGADQRALVEYGWSSGVRDAAGRAAALLTTVQRGTRMSARIEAFGQRSAERQIRVLVDEWKERGKPGLERLSVSVSYDASPKAWRTSRRGDCWIAFDWN